MSKIVVTTDTNCSLTKQDADKLGVKLLPMPMTLDGKGYFENIDISYSEFMEKLENGAEVFTSQPAPGSVTALWDEALKEADYVIHVPMDPVLSGSYQTACLLADEYDGKVKVVNVRRVSLLLLQAIRDILKLIDEGKDVDQIVELVNQNSDNNACYVALGELEHLRKGGRISATAAFVGTVLSVKPIIRFNKGALETVSKARGIINGEKMIIDAIKNELETNFKDKHICFHIAYSCSKEEAEKFKEKVCATFGIDDVEMAPLPASLTCHIGPGARGLAITQVID